MSTSEANGEYVVFWQQVVSNARQFIGVREVSEDRTDETTEATLSGTRLGPYVGDVSGDGAGARFQFQRSAGFEWTDAKNGVLMDLETVTEFS